MAEDNGNQFSDEQLSKFDFIVTDEEAVGIAEKNLYPDEVERRWDLMYSKARLTSVEDKNALRLKVLLYLIRNSYSQRSPFEKQIRIGSHAVESSIIRDCLGADVRRFANDPRNVQLQWSIMNHPSNDKLRELQGHAWQIDDRRLWRFCFEGSLSRPELANNDKHVIAQARALQISTASSFVRSHAALTTNNNPANTAGSALASGVAGQVMPATLATGGGGGSLSGFSAYD